jgi:Phage tail protein
MALEYDLTLHDDGSPVLLEGSPTDPESCYLLQSVEGLDGRDLRDEVLDLPDRDGDYLGSVRQAGLVLVLAGKIVGVDRDDLRARERTLRAALAPTSATWRLRVAGRVGDPEDLTADVRTSAPFRCSDTADHSRRFKDFQVALRAADAVLYGADEELVTAYPVAGSGGLDFPLDFTMDFVAEPGAEDLGETVTNAGDADAWPVLRVYGPMTYPRLENLTTGAVTVLTGTIAEDAYVEVDARASSPLTLNGATSVYSMLDRTASTLWPLVPGANQVRVRAAAFSGSARLEVYWRNAYL